MDEAIGDNPDVQKIVDEFAKDKQSWWKQQQYVIEQEKFGAEFSQNIARKDIKKLAIFASAPDAFVESLAMKVKSLVYKVGQNIVNANDPSDAIYFILGGEVEVVGVDGTVYAEMPSGAFFGEVGVLLDINRTASIRVKSDQVYVFELSKVDLHDVVSAYPIMKDTLKTAADERYALVKKREEPHSSGNITSEEKHIEQFDMEVAGQSLGK
ncbi:Kinesin-like protein kif27, partial [Physocladia obscura]